MTSHHARHGLSAEELAAPAAELLPDRVALSLLDSFGSMPAIGGLAGSGVVPAAPDQAAPTLQQLPPSVTPL